MNHTGFFSKLRNLPRVFGAERFAGDSRFMVMGEEADLSLYRKSFDFQISGIVQGLTFVLGLS